MLDTKLGAMPSMRSYEPYVVQLEEMVNCALSGSVNELRRDSMNLVLDGGPGSQLRSLVDLSARRTAGAFFTGTGLRQHAISLVTLSETVKASILDPTCGVGDLLIAFTQMLPVDPDLVTTLAIWGERLHGFDIHPEFLRATKARLILAALNRGAIPSGAADILSLDGLFPNIKMGDSLSCTSLPEVSHVLLNPPYGAVSAPDTCSWGAGHVSAAALFLESCLCHLSPKTQVVSILPDVLRTGSRYNKWRKRIEELAHVEHIEIAGQFDKWTDVHVFLLRLTSGQTVNKRSGMWWTSSERPCEQRVADHFNVSIGPVVPHRDPNMGQWCKYIYARLLSGQERFNIEKAKCRHYRGRLVTPPFVVVRRTTRPDCERRILGTIITGTRDVAVENHLIILQPKNGTVEMCENLLKSFADPRTKDWLDERIRCRHFTVSSVAELPLWGCYAYT